MNRGNSCRDLALPRHVAGEESRSAGFTLIEMLVVLAILGIIGTMGVTTYIRESRVAAVRQAAIEMQSDIETLRSSTIRYNGDSKFALATGGKGYTLTIASNPAATTITRTFSNGVTATTTASDLTYKAPLSTVDAPDRSYTLSFDSISYYVKVIGVTGKAVLSATP